MFHALALLNHSGAQPRTNLQPHVAPPKHDREKEGRDMSATLKQVVATS